MPIYDRSCPQCAWSADDCYEPIACEKPCPNCGVLTERIWKQRAGAVIDDSWPGGKTFENLGHEPVTVYSKSELKREMAARGLESFVRHVGEQGSDKSKHTSRWI